MGTKIMGESIATQAQMINYLNRLNPSLVEVVDLTKIYLEEGKIEGIRGDIAFAQSCLETGNFKFEGSAVTLDQNNFCGMGVTSNGMKGNSFITPQLGIRAQIQHLKAYGSTEPLVNECIDPRFKYVTRGCAEYVEWLGIQENPNRKGWAGGANYGTKILNILDRILQESNECSLLLEVKEDNIIPEKDIEEAVIEEVQKEIEGLKDEDITLQEETVHDNSELLKEEELFSDDSKLFLQVFIEVCKKFLNWFIQLVRKVK